MEHPEGPLLQSVINKIGALDQGAMAAARNHQNSLAIPLGSLGRLHEIGIRLAGITGHPRPLVRELAVVTMAGDHGVAARGVSKFPQAVTREMVANFARGGAAINVLARHAGARLTVVDMGVAGPAFDISLEDPMGRFLSRKIAQGTGDISRGPAMTRDQAIQALEQGIRIFSEELGMGLHAVGTGEMGIANTTPASAVACALLNETPEGLVNRGTGIDDEALKNKERVVAAALEINRPDPDDPVDVLAKVGGFEIGGLAGLILAACAHRTPVVVDGFISTAAALLASGFHKEVRQYLFGGHISAVTGHGDMLERLGLRPMVDLGLRLGEGTGATFGLSILRAASRVANEILTFEEAGVTGPESTP